MAITIECQCGKRYHTKDEYAGRKTRCPSCHEVIRIGRSGNGEHSATSSARPSLPRVAAPTRHLDDAFHEPAQHHPLNAEQLDVLKETEMYRRRIRNAASCYRVEFLGCLISTVVSLLITGLFAGIGPAGPEIGGILAVMVVGLGLAVLFFVARRATWQCHGWAPMLMLILHALGAGFYLLVGVVAASTDQQDGQYMLLAFACISLIPGTVAILSFRAWAAIPEFLDEPAWSQEALLYCGL